MGPARDGGGRSESRELGVCLALGWGREIKGQVRLGCRVSREVPVLAVPISQELAELRESGAAEKKAGEQGTTHRDRWSAAALCLGPRRRRSRPGCSSPGSSELPPAPRQSSLGSGPAPTRTAPAAAPPPAPPLPWPAGPHLLRSGGQRGPARQHLGPLSRDPD